MVLKNCSLMCSLHSSSTCVSDVTAACIFFSALFMDAVLIMHVCTPGCSAVNFMASLDISHPFSLQYSTAFLHASSCAALAGCHAGGGRSVRRPIALADALRMPTPF